MNIDFSLFDYYNDKDDFEKQQWQIDQLLNKNLQNYLKNEMNLNKEKMSVR